MGIGWLIPLAVVILSSIYFLFIKPPDARDRLVKAAEKDDIPKVRQLLENKKANKTIDSMGANGNRLLHYASGEWKEPDIVERIIDLGADVNIKNGNKRTPLHVAAENNNFEALKILLENGADIHAKDIHQITPLDIVQKKNRKKTVELFEKYN